LCLFVTHRSAKYYPDPLHFDPARFDRSAVAQRPRFAYFPFGGGGVHQCLSEQFARLWCRATRLACGLP
jgi:cytochrome P450